MDILRIEHLSKIYGKGDTEVRALDDVSFTVPKGQFVAIIGPSGSGKSTLLHILGGVDTPTDGHVYVDGTDITTLDETALAILTVEENMTLPLLLDDKKVDRAHFDSLVQVLGLQHRLGHLPSELSGGQQQRVSIGRALMNNPAILLADEPTGNLDSKNSREIVELLRSFNKSLNQTVIIITHDERIALDADRVIAVEDGKIVKDEVIRQ